MVQSERSGELLVFVCSEGGGGYVRLVRRVSDEIDGTVDGVLV